MLAQIVEGVIESVAHLIAHDPADADPAGLGQGLQACRDIHPIAEDVVLLSDHVAEIDADAEPYPQLLGHLTLAVDHPALDLHSASHGVHHTGKFGQQPVAGVLYGTPPVFPDLWLDQIPEMRFLAFVRPLLIRPHKPRIPCHIGGEDRGEAADRRHR